MTDYLISAAPWLAALLAGAAALRCECSWKVVAMWALAAGLGGAGVLRTSVRPSILDRQMVPIEQMHGRNQTAEEHLRLGKLQAAESLLFQVVSEAKQLDGSRWLLPEARAECAMVHANAERTIGLLKDHGNQLTERIGRLLQEHEFELAVIALDAAGLDPTDAFARALQDFVWHTVNGDLAAAETCVGRLAGTAVDLRGLRRVISSEREEIESRHKSIAEAVRDLVEAACHTPGLAPGRRGRAMVWDFTRDGVEHAYELLPGDMRATARDGVLTMFCIRKREQVTVGSYSVSGQPAFRERLEIAVIYWPSRQCAGVTTVHGGMPVSVRRVRHSPEYGSSIHIKEWIEGLPDEPGATTPRKPVRSLAELRASVREQRAREEAEWERQAAQDAEQDRRTQRHDAQGMTAPAGTAPPAERPPRIDLQDAIRREYVHADVTGAGLQSVAVTLQSAVDESFVLIVPAGTVFAPASVRFQNMMAVRDVEIRLDPRNPTATRTVPAACLNMDRDAPGRSNALTVSARASGDLALLAASARFREAPSRIRQFAVWTVTDNPSAGGYTGIGPFGIGSGPSADERAAIRSLLVECGIDPRKYRAFGGGLTQSARRQSNPQRSPARTDPARDRQDQVRPLSYEVQKRRGGSRPLLIVQLRGGNQAVPRQAELTALATRIASDGNVVIHFYLPGMSTDELPWAVATRRGPNRPVDVRVFEDRQPN